LLWLGVVALLVALATYVSVGRLLVTNVAAWRTEILRELNARGPFVIEAENLRGEWHSFTPVLVFTGLQLGIRGSADPPLVLSGGRVAVDVLDSLLTGSLQLTRVVLEDLSLRGELTDAGSLLLQGLGLEGGAGGRVREFLLNTERITLRNNRLLLTLPGGEQRRLGLDLVLTREGSHRRVDARLTSTRGAEITLLAEGLGNPFEPDHFSGRFYVEFNTTDLGAVRDLLGDRALPLWAGGAANLRVWLDWAGGGTSMQAELAGRDLLVAPADAAWQLPLEGLSLKARLDRDGDRWRLLLADVQVDGVDAALNLPRLQLDVETNRLELRAVDVPLAPLAALATGAGMIPPGLREAVATLRPQGRLDRLRVAIDDLGRPADSWDLAANFERLAVDAFKGAPGVRAVSGFANMAPGGGSVRLDSRDVTLEFPLVYSRALHFEDVYGTVGVDWDATGVHVRSGLLTTEGEEGRANVLFGLDIPREPRDVGVEMDLLVGLQDSHPRYRVKYLPDGLDPALLAWLDDSIGDGRVEQGAFLWRGSVRKGAGLLRTVQMAFNVADTELAYHPRWPPVRVREGVVLIDDTEVSVWAERADLFDSTVQPLSVATRVNARKQIQLAVAGRVSGPAADGLRVLNESPLADIVGGAFRDWRLAGSLETDLELDMNLGDRSERPRVEVTTRWRGGDMTVAPGNLQFEGINGELDYSTTAGFRSRSLTATLWGEPVSATLAQRHDAGTQMYDPATSILDIALETEVDMNDLVSWLHLDLLRFASGRAATAIGIRIEPGAPPLLSASSDLRGVSLDLPAPWRKREGEERDLQFELPLAAGARALTMRVGEELRLELDLAPGGVTGGALGINVAPPAPGEGFLRVSGHSALVQGDEWIDFVGRYIARAAGNPAAPVETPPGSAGPATAPALGIRIEDLQADTLVILGQVLEDAGLGLDVGPAMFHLALDTDWLQADLAVPREGGTYVLDVERLDLDRLPSLNAGGDAQEPGRDLPRVDVTLGNLFQSDRRLGDLAFEVSSTGDVVTVEHISGELAHLRLPPESPATLVWHRGDHTELRAGVRFGDLGETLQYLGYERIVETASGRFALDLTWPGAPQQYALAAAQGSVTVAMGAGSFLEAPTGAQGALRVVSILNLADIVRRLSLSQMFESGIPFDSVNGEVYLHGGTLEVAYMDVAGGSSFHFSGVSDIASQSLGGELVATLPVANNLPWIAALAASLPVAAGVFVVSQVFNKQVQRLSSAVYAIGGTWNDPEVNFDHIYDNTNKDATASERAVGQGGLGAGAAAGAESLPAPPGQRGSGSPPPATNPE